MSRDVFVCHASEDRASVVTPLVKAFDQNEISYWLDEAEIRWGDSITQKVNEGLSVSRFVIVVLSAAFLSKNWPQRELNAILNIEASTGEVKTLPLIVGDQGTKTEIINKLPLLNDKKHLLWDGNPESIVTALNARLKNFPITSTKTNAQPVHETPRNVHLPKLRKSFSQHDRDSFLKRTFDIIRSYFKHALNQLNVHYNEVDIEYVDVHALKFIAKLYVNGELRNQCKVWIGDLSSADSIGYSERGFDINNDNSYNDILSIENDGFQLYLKFLVGHSFLQENPEKLIPERAAEKLWERFSSSLQN